NIPERIPALKLLLDGKLILHHRFDAQLESVVASVVGPRHEGVEFPPLEVINQVDLAALGVIESEERRQQGLAEALLLKRAAREVHRRDEIFELRVGQDYPDVPILVGGGLNLRLRLSSADDEQILNLAPHVLKVA